MTERRAPYRIEFDAALDPYALIPASILDRLHESMDDIARSVVSFPRQLLTGSLQSTTMQLDLGEWRFTYTLHHTDRLIVVRGTAPLTLAERNEGRQTLRSALLGSWPESRLRAGESH